MEKKLSIALAALNKIISLDPGLWQTAQKIAAQAIKEISGPY